MIPVFQAPLSAGRPMVNQGQHVGRIYSIIILGTIPDTYQGVTKQMLKAQVTMEFTDNMHQFEDGLKPLVYSQKFTLSMGDSASLRKFVNQVLGVSLNDTQAKVFNVFELLDKSVNVVVAHKAKQNGGMKEVLTSVMPLMQGQQAPQGFNPLLYWYYDAAWLASPQAVQMWDRIPPYMKNEILLSQELQQFKNGFSAELKAAVGNYVQERAAKAAQAQQPQAPQQPQGFALPTMQAPQQGFGLPTMQPAPQPQVQQPQAAPVMPSYSSDDDLPF